MYTALIFVNAMVSLYILLIVSLLSVTCILLLVLLLMKSPTTMNSDMAEIDAVMDWCVEK